jgi:hypothetical protein
MLDQVTYEKLSAESEANCTHPLCTKQVKNIVKKCEDEIFTMFEKNRST